jgi:hypothetical protein
VQKGGVTDLVGVAILADVAQIIDQAACILVSPGVKKSEAEKLGMGWAKNGNEALQMAFERSGAGAKVAVLKHGGHVLPLADERAAALHGGGEGA